MNTITFVHAGGSVDRMLGIPRQQLRVKLQITGAAVGLIGGFGAGISGGLLTAFSWTSANQAARHWLSSAGSTLLLLTIPLIIMGAFCLDWLEKKNQPQHQTNSTLNNNDEQ